MRAGRRLVWPLRERRESIMRIKGFAFLACGLFAGALAACGGGGGGGGPTVQATSTPASTPTASPPASAAIDLGTQAQPLANSTFGLSFFPDMHTALVKQISGQYAGQYFLFVDATVTPGTGTIRGGTTVLASSSLTGGFSPPFTDGAGNAIDVLPPSCPQQYGSSIPDPTCGHNFDSDYAGINAVWKSSDGSKLIAQYHGETRSFGSVHNAHTPFYAYVGIAQSSDGGKTWTNRQPVISSNDAVPATTPASKANGAVEGSTIVGKDGFLYTYYANFPPDCCGYADAGANSTIQVARAPVALDGAANTWTKFYQGSFGSQPGIGGLGDSLLSATAGCLHPRQPWVTFSTFHSKYVMLLVCSTGLSYATATAPQGPWTAPQVFLALPPAVGCEQLEFVQGCPTVENAILMTPGNPDQMTIGQTGIVIFAYSPAWQLQGHTLYEAPYTLESNL
jgi:hypothetical protein